MSFRDDAKLDPSEVSDRRGRGGMGRIAVGGGGLGVGGLVIVLLFALLGGGGSLGQLGQLQDQTSAGAPTGDLADCRTGADANERQDCRILGYVNSVQSFWRAEFPRQGRTYTPATTYFETGQWQTGCGAASSDSGPFYCPADQHVYIDLALPRPAAGPVRRDRRLARPGLRDRPRVRSPRAEPLRHAGRAARAARARPASRCAPSCRPTASPACGPHTRPRPGCSSRSPQAQIDDALNAAAAVGDDRIQAQTQGGVNPDQWTHGSSAQRQRWFSTGYESGDMKRCDTFGGSI